MSDSGSGRVMVGQCSATLRASTALHKFSDVIAGRPLGRPAPVAVELIPPAARVEWLRLSDALVDVGTVPCQQSDAEAWWPVVGETDDYGPWMAVDACSTRPDQAACLSYAVAGEERQRGIWGGTLPAERRKVHRTAA